MTEVTAKEAAYGVASVEMLSPPPLTRLTLTDSPGTVVDVDGMAPNVAMGIPWKEIFDFIVDKLGSGDGGTPKGGGCTEVAISRPDGSSTTIKDCPAKKS